MWVSPDIQNICTMKLNKLEYKITFFLVDVRHLTHFYLLEMDKLIV